MSRLSRILPSSTPLGSLLQDMSTGQPFPTDVRSALQDSWSGVKTVMSSENPVFSVLMVCITLSLVYLTHRPRSHIPLLNGRKAFELTYTRSRKDFITGARDMIVNWFTVHPEKPVRVMADIGMMTLLSPLMANELRNDSRLDFAETLKHVFHTYLPGFEALRPAHDDKELVRQVIVKDLTKYLNKVTLPLSREAETGLFEIFTDEKEWHEVHLKEGILSLVSRMSSRVFLGDQLCRNPKWLAITKEYTMTVIAAAEQLRVWPKGLRYIVHWFLPSCRKLRQLVKEAREIITPVLEKRQEEKRTLKGQSKMGHFEDAMEWFERSSKGTAYDPASVQLFMAFSAINSTADLICQVITDIAQHPDIIEPLRREIISVLSDGGLNKTSLYNMKLLDSVVKESQRLKPITTAPMRRLALEDVKLSDGTLIRKGQMLAVSPHLMWNAKQYEEPASWNGYRFYNMRQTPGQENISQLVSTSPTHLGFGHGQHACPGRFFAAIEMKIVLSQLLLKYDWKLAPGSAPKIRPYGVFLTADPTTKVVVRRREEEIKV